MIKVLVTDANYRTALVVIRSLGRRNIHVAGVQSEGLGKFDAVGFYSRYCQEKIYMPSYRTDQESFLRNLIDISAKYDVIFPISAQLIMLLSKHLDKLQGKMAIADYATLTLANSKDKLLNIARECAVPIPRTTSFPDLSQLDAIAKCLDYPAVIKFRSDENLYLPAEKRYAIAYNSGDLVENYKKMHAIQAFPLIQEYIQGPGFGFSAIFDRRHQPKALFCHRRIREYPISGGPSACCESVYEPKLIEYGLRLLSAIKWVGVAMVEFKFDRRDKEFKLMEINPRIWGSAALAVASGVDFPYLLFKTAMGEDFRPVMQYRVGTKLRFIGLDLLAVKDYVFKAKKIKYLIDFLKDIFNIRVKDGILELGDLKPALFYFFKYLGIILRPKGNTKEEA